MPTAEEIREQILANRIKKQIVVNREVDQIESDPTFWDNVKRNVSELNRGIETISGAVAQELPRGGLLFGSQEASAPLVEGKPYPPMGEMAKQMPRALIEHYAGYLQNPLDPMGAYKLGQKLYNQPVDALLDAILVGSLVKGGATAVARATANRPMRTMAFAEVPTDQVATVGGVIGHKPKIKLKVPKELEEAVVRQQPSKSAQESAQVFEDYLGRQERLARSPQEYELLKRRLTVGKTLIEEPNTTIPQTVKSPKPEVAKPAPIVAYHGGSTDFPTEISGKHFGGFHAGTEKAAQDRIARPSEFGKPRSIHEVEINPSKPYLPNGKMLDERIGTDRTRLFYLQNLEVERAKLIKEGYDVIPYINAVEDPGSVSYMVLDPKIVRKSIKPTPAGAKGGESGRLYIPVEEISKIPKNIAASETVDRVRRVVSQAENRVKTPLGKEIINEMQDVRADRYGLAGQYITAYRMIGGKPKGIQLTEQLMQEPTTIGKKGTTDFLEMILDVERKSGKGVVSPQSKEVRLILDRIAEDFKNAGGKIRDKDGNVRDFAPREKYVPRRLKEEIRLALYDDIVSATKKIQEYAVGAEGTISQREVNAILKRLGEPEVVGKEIVKLKPQTRQAIEHIMQTQNISFDKAFRILDNFIQNETYNPFGNLEKARTVELPSGFYEKDFNKIFPDYVMGASRAISEVRKWGADRAGVTSRIKELMLRNPRDGELVNQLYELSTGLWEKNHPMSPAAKKAVNAFINFEVTTKIGLGTAVIPNITQTLISSAVKAPWHRVFRGGFRYMTNKEFRTAVRESGATVAEAMQMLTGHESTGPMSKVTKTIMTPFSAINRSNKALAAATAKDWIPSLYRAANGEGALSKIPGYKAYAKRQLLSMGINYTKPLEGIDIQKGAFRFASDTQLQKDVFKEPIWFNDPKLRPFALFKRFGYRQYNFMRTNVVNEITHGNPMPLLRLAAGGYVGGKFVLWAKGKIKEILSGEPYDDKDLPMWRDLVNTYAAVGAMGMVSDLGRSYSDDPEKFRKDIVENLMFQINPVAINEPLELGESAAKIAGSKDPLNQALKEGLSKSVLGRYIGERVEPGKPSGRK